MKTRNPKSRFDLKIKNSDYVLEIGGGHNPHPRADVVVDKHPEDNAHRGGNLRIHKHQKFIEADGENLPFRDNEFDYVICCHVLEHVDNPGKFLREMSRVAKRGYIEVPSLTGEFLSPKNSHQWVTLEINSFLVVQEKEEIGMVNSTHDFGDLFLYHLNSQSLAFKTLMKTHPDLFTVRYEWDDEIQYIINPSSENLKSYFTKPWDNEIMQNQFPKKTIWKEALEFMKGFTSVAATFFVSLLKNRTQQSQKQIGMQHQYENIQERNVVVVN